VLRLGITLCPTVQLETISSSSCVIRNQGVQKNTVLFATKLLIREQHGGVQSVKNQTSN